MTTVSWSCCKMNFNRMLRTACRPFLFAHMERKGVGASFRFTQTTRHLMELTGEQLKLTEIHLKRYLPQSQQAYGCLVLRNRVTSDPVRVLVDRWPEFNVIVCKPKYEQKGDLFKTTVFFAKDEAVLEETLRKSSVIDWTQYLCVDINLRHVEIFKAVAREKGVFSSSLTVSHMLLADVSNLPSIDRSGISLSSLDESHVDLVNQMWRYGRNERTVRMIRNMVANFPSCCVLDAEGKPVSWILTFASCAMGMFHTLPEHRGKGYGKVVISTLAKRLHAQGYPVYGFREEENMVIYRFFRSMGLSEDPSHREACIVFNEF